MLNSYETTIKNTINSPTENTGLINFTDPEIKSIRLWGCTLKEAHGSVVA